MWDDEPNRQTRRARDDRAPPSQDHRRDCRLGPAATGQSGRTEHPLRQHRLPLPRRPAAAARARTWTRTVDNRTVTRTLDPAQAERLRPLLDNSRRLRELVSELEGLALPKVENDPAQPDP